MMFPGVNKMPLETNHQQTRYVISAFAHSVNMQNNKFNMGFVTEGLYTRSQLKSVESQINARSTKAHIFIHVKTGNNTKHSLKRDCFISIVFEIQRDCIFSTYVFVLLSRRCLNPQPQGTVFIIKMFVVFKLYTCNKMNKKI